MLRQSGILPTYFLMFLFTIPVAPMMTGMTSTFLFHSFWHSICEIYILPHLLSGLLLDVVVTWNGHIYDLAPIRLLLLYDYVWFVAGDMSVGDDLGVPQDSCLLILHHLYRLMVIPTLCFYFDAIVPAYVQVQLDSYLVVPVKVLNLLLMFGTLIKGVPPTVSDWVWHILHLSVVPCLMMCLL